MIALPPEVKLRVFLIACSSWVLAGIWLVGCVLASAPLRQGVGAGLAVALLSWVVWFVRHEIEMDQLQSRAQAPARASNDDDWELGSA